MSCLDSSYTASDSGSNNAKDDNGTAEHFAALRAAFSQPDAVEELSRQLMEMDTTEMGCDEQESDEQKNAEETAEMVAKLAASSGCSLDAQWDAVLHATTKGGAVDPAELAARMAQADNMSKETFAAKG